MSNRSEVIAAVRESAVVGIVRTKDPESAERTARALLMAGLPLVEVSLVTPGAVDVIARLSGLHVGIVGAGTVLDVAQVAAVHAAGARFIVSPVLLPQVIDAAASRDLATLPGVATATEAVTAVAAGADFVKIFPASLYGPTGVRDLLTALPSLPVVPTGGVALEQVGAYLAAGSTAVGLGSCLSAGSDDEIQQRVATLRAWIQRVRNLDGTSGDS